MLAAAGALMLILKKIRLKFEAADLMLDFSSYSLIFMPSARA